MPTAVRQGRLSRSRSGKRAGSPPSQLAGSWSRRKSRRCNLTEDNGLQVVW